MKKFTSGKTVSLLAIILFFAFGCNTKPGVEIPASANEPAITPLLSGITIPFNIAPLNFSIKENGKLFFVRLHAAVGNAISIQSTNGKIAIPEYKWRKLLEKNKDKDLTIEVFSKNPGGEWMQFKSISCHISPDPVDPFVFYRLLFPGYDSWSGITIVCRSTGSFNSHPLMKNAAVDDNCINCHSFNNGRTGDFLFHMRGSHAGTWFYTDGRFSKINLKPDELTNGSVYPRWHPSGKYVAFSSNKIRQRFHAADNKKVEVSDLESSLVLYDVAKNEIMKLGDDTAGKYMDTYPEWSPDGNYIYFCRAPQVAEDFDYKMVRYDLYRAPFDQAERKTGKPEIVFNASATGKSVSFPRISPDGRFMIITMADYGCFPIWHREADLYSLDLAGNSITKLELNSALCESYHSWSSNGRWIIFSSKRDDGLTARPYIAWFDGNGNTGKPFILPQKDPAFYDNCIKTFNIPEFSSAEIRIKPGEARRLAGTRASQSEWVKNRKE